MPPFLHLPSEIETMNICKIIMGHVFATTYPGKTQTPQKTHVPHLITLSAGKKNPFKKNWGKCFFQATYQQQLHALLTVIVFPPRPYSILLLMSMRVMSIRSTALHFKFPRRNSLLFFCALPHSLVLLYNATPFMLTPTPVFYIVTHLGFRSHHVRTINAPIKMRELLVICAFTDAIF